METNSGKEVSMSVPIPILHCVPIRTPRKRWSQTRIDDSPGARNARIWMPRLIAPEKKGSTGNPLAFLVCLISEFDSSLAGPNDPEEPAADRSVLSVHRKAFLRDMPAEWSDDREILRVQFFEVRGNSESCLDLDDQLKRSEEHTSELQSRPHLVCRLLLEKKK